MQIERFPNPNRFAINLKSKVSEIDLYRIKKHWRTTDAMVGGVVGMLHSVLFGRAEARAFKFEHEQKQKIGDLIDNLLAVDGVVEVSIYQYSINITKATLHETNNIFKEIQKVLRAHKIV